MLAAAQLGHGGFHVVFAELDTELGAFFEEGAYCRGEPDRELVLAQPATAAASSVIALSLFTIDPCPAVPARSAASTRGLFLRFDQAQPLSR